ncbi:Mu-like prophage major head subunit gpT family protein [Bradyrhizobium sp. BR 10289]|uniref:Mu-like prophage major head subunit gpT family protein n=1 Tax=Bradyrhizobium sp. BR 10289 TaxID=2749993 RepID=UPI001C64A20F|nr:Mu-like prophage major head subunit gpT family protein [Bradyrhizobium sp. BR 10289]MBW7968125.1 Mu-like prophage major head subunit gpT family protein [Bradyrhizobium sp. BR 10289]
MIVNRQNLDGLRVGFKTTFQNQLQQTATLYQRVATVVPSTAKSETYGWLGKIPNVREWLGERIVQNLSEASYSIKNKPFELTIGVDRDDIEDDNLGIYTPLFAMFGESVAAWPDQLIWPLLLAGFATNCYDGQFFFDTDHPVLDASGNPTQVANTDGGAGTPWFLLDVSKVLKPLIWQLRKSGQFVSLDNPTDENVFNKKEFLYGWDGRGNAGYGLWQFAWGSKQTLDAAHYNTARSALIAMKGDFGRPLNVLANGTKPLLVVPSTLEGAARQLIEAERNADGSSNIWFGTAEILVCTWLG